MIYKLNIYVKMYKYTLRKKPETLLATFSEFFSLMIILINERELCVVAIALSKSIPKIFNILAKP